MSTSNLNFLGYRMTSNFVLHSLNNSHTHTHTYAERTTLTTAINWVLTICQALQCAKQLPMLCFQPLQQLWQHCCHTYFTSGGNLLVNALLEVNLGFRRLGVNSGGPIPELAVLTTTHTNHQPTPSFPGTWAWKVKKPTQATNIYCLQPNPGPVPSISCMHLLHPPQGLSFIHSTNAP